MSVPNFWAKQADRFHLPVVWREEDGTWTHDIEPHRTHCDTRHRTRASAVRCWSEWAGRAEARMGLLLAASFGVEEAVKKLEAERPAVAALANHIEAE